MYTIKEGPVTAYIEDGNTRAVDGKPVSHHVEVRVDGKLRPVQRLEVATQALRDTEQYFIASVTQYDVALEENGDISYIFTAP